MSKVGYVGQVEGEHDGFVVTYQQCASIRATFDEAMKDANAALALMIERGDTEPGQCEAVVAQC